MDTLIAYGGEIKTVGETEDAWRFNGMLIVFGSADASRMRDTFTKATVFDFEDGDYRPLYYHHGLDDTLKRTKLGRVQLKITDAGVWIEGEIKKRTDYMAGHVAKIAERLGQSVDVKGVVVPCFGLSSGAASHLVERVATSGGHEIKSWSIAEASITPTPAEPLTGCALLKSLMPQDDLPDFEGEPVVPAPEELKAGRTISAANHSALATFCAGLREHLEGIEALLGQYAPESDDDEGSPEPDELATKANDPAPVADLDLTNRVLTAMALTNARLNGVPVPGAITTGV